MRGDFSRWPSEAEKHYVAVVMQQGRVVLDSDWNEQARLTYTALVTLAHDLLGPYGAPAAHAGFGIDLDEEGRVRIGAGRYYVGGRAVENYRDCDFAAQPYFDGDSSLETEHGNRTIGTLYFLDVWERYADAIEDAALREIALGGADTSGRLQRIWQVRRKAITKRSVLEDPSEFRRREREIEDQLEALDRIATDHRSTALVLDDLTEIVRLVSRRSGRRATKTERAIEDRIDDIERALEGMTDRPAALHELEALAMELIEAADDSHDDGATMTARFRELDRAIEQQLQKRAIALKLRHLFEAAASLGREQFDVRARRVEAEVEEIHHGADFRRHALDVLEALKNYTDDLDTIDLGDEEYLEIRDLDELRGRERGTLSVRTRPGQRGYTGRENSLYRIEIHAGGNAGAATFKWSRDNAYVSARIERVDPHDRTRISIAAVPGGSAQFPAQSWVEVSDRRTALAGAAGSLLQVTFSQPGGLQLQLSGVVASDPSDDNPLYIRRWDTRAGEAAAIASVEDASWLPIEHGIEVVFSRGPYAPGDYWLVAARTATQSIDWPADDGLPSIKEPFGFRHVYAPLALIRHRAGGVHVEDRRSVFPQFHERSSGREPERETTADRAADVPKAANAVPAAIHITHINWSHDDEISIDLEREGFVLTFDRAPDPRCAISRTVLVIAEPHENRPGRKAPVVHTSLTLQGNVSIRDQTLTWKPDVGVNAHLLEVRNTEWKVPRILLRVSVRGQYIWVKSGGELIHLSGRALLGPTTRHDGEPGVGLQFPTGQTETVSDFES